MSKKNLHHKFVQLGRQRHKLKNELLALLPEIYEKGIFRKYAGSIIEYAGRYGDIAKSTVIKRLRLEKNLEDKPELKAAIKEVGMHKVAIVARLATAETDSAFADKVRNMSKSAVQTLAKELREKEIIKKDVKNEYDGDLFEMNVEIEEDEVKTGNSAKCCAKPERIKIELDEEMSFMFLKLKKKMGKYLSNKRVMRLILEKVVDEEFASKKKIVGKKKARIKAEKQALLKSHTGVTSAVKKKNSESKNSKTKNLKIQKNIHKQNFLQKEPRPIRAHQKRIALAQTNGKCTYPGCNKPAENFHHTDRYSESQNHGSVKPVCRDHHEFAHNGLIKNEFKCAENWQLDVEARPKHEADYQYRKFRQESFM